MIIAYVVLINQSTPCSFMPVFIYVTYLKKLAYIPIYIYYTYMYMYVIIANYTVVTPEAIEKFFHYFGFAFDLSIICLMYYIYIFICLRDNLCIFIFR
jgi:hypothetical protein